MHSLRALLRAARLLDGPPTSAASQALFRSREGSGLAQVLGNGLTSDVTVAGGGPPPLPMESVTTGPITHLNSRKGEEPESPQSNELFDDKPKRVFRRTWKKRGNHHPDHTVANLALLGRWGMTEENQQFVKARGSVLPAISPDHLEDKLKWLVAELDFTEAEVVKVVQNAPNFLNHSIGGKFQPLKNMFLEEGFTVRDVKIMLRKFPRLVRDANKIHLMCDFFAQELELTRADVFSMLLKHPRLVSYSIADNMSMTISRMKNLGLSPAEIGAVFLRCPGLMGRDLDNVIKKKLTWLASEFGMGEKDALEILKTYPQPFVASLDTWKKNSEYFLSMGLAKEVIAKDWTDLFGWKTEGMEEMRTFAEEVLKKPWGEIMEFPGYFKTPFASVVLFRVAFLGSKGEDYTEVSLRELCESEPKEFFKKFSMEDVEDFDGKWAPLLKAKKLELIRAGTYVF